MPVDALKIWLDSLSLGNYPLQKLQDDASFRRYFRLILTQKTYVVMDSQADLASVETYLHGDTLLKAAGLKVPEIFYSDREQGFLVLSDFGDDLYLNHLNEHTADKLYEKTFDDLFALQIYPVDHQLPLYDRNLLWNEMELFRQWYVPSLKKNFSEKENKIVEAVFEKLICSALSQPQVIVHRDYHSKNLMLLPDKTVGVLDFQDAVIGACTYDIVSLLKDCYIVWQREKVLKWLQNFYRRLTELKTFQKISFDQFVEWFDKMGLQRHLKCLGIFVRLKERDHKLKHVQHLPRVFSYVKETAGMYPEFKEFHQLLEQLEIK